MSTQLEVIFAPENRMIIVVVAVTLIIALILAVIRLQRGEPSRTQKMARNALIYRIFTAIAAFTLIVNIPIAIMGIWGIFYLSYMIPLGIIGGWLVYYFNIGAHVPSGSMPLFSKYTLMWRIFNSEIDLEKRYRMTDESKKLMNYLSSIDVTDVESITFKPFSYPAFQVKTINTKRLAVSITKATWKTIFQADELAQVFEYVKNNIDSPDINYFNTVTKHMRHFIENGGEVVINYSWKI